MFIILIMGIWRRIWRKIF